MTPLRSPLFLLVLLAAAGGSLPACAQAHEDDRGQRNRGGERAESDAREWRPVPRSERSSSLSEAVRRVQRETGGQVLGAERVQFDGRDINRVKVLDKRGRVRYMDEDPQRGRESARQDHFPRARSDNPSEP